MRNGGNPRALERNGIGDGYCTGRTVVDFETHVEGRLFC